MVHKPPLLTLDHPDRVLPVDELAAVSVSDPSAGDSGNTTASQESEDAEGITIPARAQKAYQQYRQAVEALGATDTADREAYSAFVKAHEQADEASDLPSFATWQRNAREYRDKAAGRVARVHDIEEVIGP